MKAANGRVSRVLVAGQTEPGISLMDRVRLLIILFPTQFGGVEPQKAREFDGGRGQRTIFPGAMSIWRVTLGSINSQRDQGLCRQRRQGIGR